ncbi:MAG: adenylate/guanylate cyclase domain-containing protein [Nitrospinae bacterium]|nr:adenylate/guanylate cyclase domain-containing protein [Nitrospinota bacterium]
MAVELKSLTGLEVSFFVEKKGTWEPIASTIAGHIPPTSKQIMTGEPGKDPVIHEVSFADDKWLTLGIPLAHPPGADYKITAILQHSLSKALEPYKRLRAALLLIGGVGLAISALAGIFLSRTMSRPVRLLMDQVESIEGGDYSARVSVKRKDELGALANAVNNMASGLEEKDRMRSLLGKVVSHAVAEELLSKKLELGGEEREVTILFSDIRSFTTHSENMTPNETLSLLNIYLTTMAAIIDKHGGVVDKFIGDAIMALFGAPASHEDDADRALLAALEMTSALEGLNVTLNSRGMPNITIGIGINTDNVVVGNMGSLDRMNYTAIGDGVNVASRLESLTKEYGDKIIISERTLNNAHRRYETGFLGEVMVKGKNIPVKIYALKGLAQEA